MLLLAKSVQRVCQCTHTHTYTHTPKLQGEMLILK
jgi:hypothetical protein